MRSRRVILPVVLGSVVTAGSLYLLSRLEPSWYSRAVQRFDATIDTSSNLENRLASEIQRIRDDRPWSLRISEDQVNDWLATRLRPWMEHDGRFPWPADLGEIRIRMLQGHCEIAFRYQSHVYAVRVRPVVDSESIRILSDGVSVGRLPLGWLKLGDLLSRVLSDAQEDQLAANESVAPWISGLRTGTLPIPPLRLVDDRLLLIVDAEFVPNAILVKLKTSSVKE